MKQKDPAAVKLGKRGGLATKSKYMEEGYFQRIGKKGNKAQGKKT